MTIHAITFSPTGGTKKVADILAKELGDSVVETELCLPERELTFPKLTQEDICLLAVPSFGGRVPETATRRIAALSGNGAKAILVCVYGNRAYEDTLLELKDTAEGAGFCCFAGVAALAEHSISREIAAGRPDGEDAEVLRDFAKKISEKIKRGDVSLSGTIPGNTPYKERGKSKSVPETTDACIGCGICAGACPGSAISLNHPKETKIDSCISCMKCISVCPVGAKVLNPQLQEGITRRLRNACGTRRDNELYL